jgi:hypothetical protein
MQDEPRHYYNEPYDLLSSPRAAAKLANEAIAEALGRCIHVAMLEKEERQEETEGA